MHERKPVLFIFNLFKIQLCVILIKYVHANVVFPLGLFIFDGMLCRNIYFLKSNVRKKKMVKYF